MYVCACAPVPHVIIVFKQFCILHIQYSLAHIYLQYRQYTGRHTVQKIMQNQTTLTNQTKRQKQLLNTPIGRQVGMPDLDRQVGSQHVFITGLVILPKVQTNGLSLELVSHLK